MRFGLFTLQMQVAGPLHSSQTWGAEILAVHLPLCCNETEMKGLEMNQILHFTSI